MTEAQMERAADLMVQRRLSRDSDYQNAEDWESQQTRENEISEAVWAELIAKHGEPS